VSEEEKLTEAVNRSGFPLQIGLIYRVNQTVASHGWNVLCTEHAWKNELDNDSGFIDFVLEDQYKTSVLVVECKRVLEASWIFLIDSSSIKEQSHGKLWVTSAHGITFEHFDWFNIPLNPVSPESGFCVVPGQDSKSRPMLERLAGECVSATEALAKEERMLLFGETDSIRMYGSVIVTTASLKVCEFNPENISLINGKVTDPYFTDVPFIRFRKQLSVRSPKINFLSKPQLNAVAKAKEHTVFIVNSQALESFLQEWEVSDSGLRNLR